MLKINFTGGKQLMPVQNKQIIDANSDPSISKIAPSNYNPPVSPMRIPKYHWARQPVDTRDIPLDLPPISTPPSVIDLRAYCSPVDDQGQLGSCTGNAIAGCIEYMDRRYNNKQTQVSRMFIYYYERLIEGTVNYDSGAYIRDGIKATYTYGAPLESLWPYTISKFKTPPTVAAVQDGARRKVTLYQSIANGNVSACQTALAAGFPVVIGFDVYSSFESQTVANTGMMPYPNTRTEKLLGGHCVLLVGYNNNSQRFIVRNSWGSNWGDRGYFYMPYQVIQNTSMSSDFWVNKSVSDPT